MGEKENNLPPCLLCGDEIVSDEVLVTKGINKIIESSKLWKDNVGRLLANVQEITLHAACRKKYTDPRKIAAGLKMREARRSSLRSSLCSPFDYKLDCVVCGTPCPSQEQRLKHP